jgi:hypothetical protein
MPKPKGGRGYKAPYETHQIRVPDPIADQVHTLIERYQDYLERGGEVDQPPSLLDQSKPVDKFITGEKQFVAVRILEQALRLKANAGGAIKKEIEKALVILRV